MTYIVLYPKMTSAMHYHPTFTNYACNDLGEVWNIKTNRKLVSNPTVQRKGAKGQNIIIYQLTLFKDGKSISKTLPRFLYECVNKCELQPRERVYHKNKKVDDNTPANLVVKGGQTTEAKK